MLAPEFSQPIWASSGRSWPGHTKDGPEDVLVPGGGRADQARARRGLLHHDESRLRREAGAAGELEGPVQERRHDGA